MKTTLKNGKQGTLTIDSKAQVATVATEGVTKLVAFVRDSKKVVVKNKTQVFLSHTQLSHANLLAIVNHAVGLELQIARCCGLKSYGLQHRVVLNVRKLA